MQLELTIIEFSDAMESLWILDNKLLHEGVVLASAGQRGSLAR